MSVRAKFLVNSYETSLQRVLRDGLRPDGKPRNWNDPHDVDIIECRTVKMAAVADGSEENKKFFRYTPNGNISIGMLNPEAWAQLELNKEFYVDFHPAEGK